MILCSSLLTSITLCFPPHDSLHVKRKPLHSYFLPCNKTPHTSTKDTPFYLLKGRNALEPTDVRPPMRNRILEDETNTFSRQWHDALETVRANSVMTQAKQKEAYDKKTSVTHYEPGGQVLLKEMKTQTGKFYLWTSTSLHYIEPNPTTCLLFMFSL